MAYPRARELVFNWKFGPGKVRGQERAFWNHLPRVTGGAMRTILP